ncbi:3890_t:CDS:2 [Diversispora eburnea]|uniref:Mitochondrial import inner membrane translocase subunit TIM16 n=1 Tax=Diversispora eburnea TaxID=1213867 RepID=A0A9N8Z9P3_9GLOM|nr:3890_t:CDS:2 [Diversispora eburnea]
MAARILSQIVVTGVKIFGNAFVAAYRQAAINAKNAQSSHQNNIRREAATRFSAVDSQMTMDEAFNDVSSGGSFYVQSKIVAAKERIDEEFPQQDKVEEKS